MLYLSSNKMNRTTNTSVMVGKLSVNESFHVTLAENDGEQKKAGDYFKKRSQTGYDFFCGISFMSAFFCGPHIVYS